VPQRFTVPELVGERVRLVALTPEHADALLDAATEEGATYAFTSVPQHVEGMSLYVTDLLAQRDEGLTIPFVQVDRSTRRVVGVTRYLTIRTRAYASTPYAVEIGGTWLAASAQRTGINRNAKQLLLDYAFATWGVVRVDIKTDARNEKAREAITKLGATFEGVLRQWQPSQNAGEERLYRNSAMYSVLDTEWPAMRKHLADQSH
jgi:RimJ/RimL family protein N-acetyltransferase